MNSIEMEEIATIAARVEREEIIKLADSKGWGMKNDDSFGGCVREICNEREKISSKDAPNNGGHCSVRGVVEILLDSGENYMELAYSCDGKRIGVGIYVLSVEPDIEGNVREILNERR